MNKYLAAVLCVLTVLSFGPGCSGQYEVRRVGPGRYVVSLIPDDAAGGGSSEGGAGGPAVQGADGAMQDDSSITQSSGEVADEPSNPPAPSNDNPPPSGTGVDPQVPDTAKGKLQELKERFGITVRGYPTEHDIDNLYVAASQYRPDETASVTINYAKGNKTSGVMGMYSPSGNMEIYDHRHLHTVFHELTHHITLYRRNKRARAIAEEVARMTPPENGTVRETPARYIPRSYARTNIAEYWAEFFSYLREKERGLRGGYPCSPYFNPPEDIRKVARRIYAD